MTLPRRIALAGPVDLRALSHLLYPSRENRTDISGLGSSVLTEIVEPLLQAGIEILLVTLDLETDREVVLDGPGLRIRVGPYRKRHRARDWFRFERAFVRSALAGEPVDLIHAYWTYEFALGALETGKTTIITVEDWAPRILRLARDPYRFVRLTMHVACLIRGRHFVAVSPYIRRRLSRVGKKDVPVIPNGVGVDWLSNPVAGRNQRLPIVLAANNGFSRWKNVATLIKAFSLVREAEPGARLLLAGADFGPDELAARWARDHRLIDGVEFLGEVPRSSLPGLMSRALVLAHPSIEDAMPMVVVEAMASGTPVVAGSKTEGPAWAIGDSAGLLVDVRDPAAIAAGILKIWHNSPLWHSMSRSGRERVQAEFRADSVARRYLEQYAATIGAER